MSEDKGRVIKFKAAADPATQTRELIDGVLDEEIRTPVEEAIIRFENRIKSVLTKDTEKIEGVRRELFSFLNMFIENEDNANEIILDILSEIELNLDTLLNPKSTLNFPKNAPSVIVEKSLKVHIPSPDLLESLSSVLNAEDLKVRIVDFFNLWIEANVLSRFPASEFDKSFNVGMAGIILDIDNVKGNIIINYILYIDLLLHSEDDISED